MNCTAKSLRSMMYSSSDLSKISEALLKNHTNEFNESSSGKFKTQMAQLTFVLCPLFVCVHFQASIRYLDAQTKQTTFAIERGDNVLQQNQMNSAVDRIVDLPLFAMILTKNDPRWKIENIFIKKLCRINSITIYLPVIQPSQL